MERTQHIYRRRKKEESDKMTGAQLLINIMAWFVIHMLIAYRCTKISPFYLTKDLALFKVQTWETVGIYKKFGVHRRKTWLPDGGKLFKRGFYRNKSSRVISLDQHTSFYSFFYMELSFYRCLDGYLCDCCKRTVYFGSTI